MKMIQDYAIRNWGFEDENTIELFKMIERGATLEDCFEYIELVDFNKSLT